MSEEKSALTLHYFGVKARGHTAIVANAFWGKDLKWEKYGGPEWGGNKDDIKSHCAFGQLPVLQDGDNWVPQSNAIVRYLGQKWGKDGSSSDKDFAMSEQLIEESVDIFKLLGKAKYPANTIEAWDDALQKLPKHWTNIERLMTGTKFGSEYLMGDMALFAAINIVYDSDPNTLSNHSNLKKWYDEIAGNENVKAACEDCQIYFQKPKPNLCDKAKLMEVGYWDIRGLAAPLRMICEYAEVKYNNTMYGLTGTPGNWSADSWFKEANAKPRILAKNAFANLPYIVDGDVVICQSNACLKYLGRKFNLMGKNRSEEIKVDQCLCQIMDLRNDMVKLFYGSADDYKKTSDMSATKHLVKMENWLNHNKTDYCAGDSPTVADFHLWELIDQLELWTKDTKKDSLIAEKPKLKQLYTNIQNESKLSSYFKGDLYKLPLNNKMANFK